MDKKQEHYFNILSQERTKAAEALEGFALRGVKNSVVEKYSDQAHFIYELLQNADDAKATTARFELHKDKLIFAHNGTRRFTVSDPVTEETDKQTGKLGDINAITAVGGSNKTDQETIGKFGVGFKAVFQYTATPHIYDPNIFFKIERFIVPVRLDADHPDRRPNETLFVFPFDHDNRTPQDAYSDISEKLTSLDYPLLFLSNLKDITFEISDVLGLYGKSIEETHNFDHTVAELINLTQTNDSNRESLDDYLLWMFSRYDDEGHRYSIGFFVEDVYLIPKVHPAFCFFPTRETTSLNFILHAPFLLTDSREGIRAGVQHNNALIQLLSELAADSLIYLRDIGQEQDIRFIDDDIFDIVPYDSSQFSDINNKNRISFKPFYTAMKDVFTNEEIIPTDDGYVSSENAYWAFVPQIAMLFSNEQLSMMVENPNAKWVFTTFGRQDTLRKYKVLTEYIDSITALWLDDGDILKGWTFEDGSKHSGITAGFIEAQPIEWLHRFYKWISESQTRTNLIKMSPIFLNKDRKATAAFNENEQAILFLPIQGGTSYPTVNDALLQDEETLAFIRQLGIREPSLQDEIYHFIVPQYQDAGIGIDTAPHFEKFFQYYQTCSQAKARDLVNSIKDISFVLYSSRSDETLYRGKAELLYFPSPQLQTWFESKPETEFIHFDVYIEIVGESNKDDLIRFFTELGVKDKPRIFERELSWMETYQISTTFPRSTQGYSCRESYIDGSQELIETIVNKQDIELSQFLWSQLLQLLQFSEYRSCFYGEYEYFYRTRRSKSYESTEAKRFRTQPWIVNHDGKFVSANALTAHALNEIYDVTDPEADRVLDFLKITNKEIIKYEEDDIASYAQSLGLSDEEQRTALRDAAERKKSSLNLAESRPQNDDSLDYDDKNYVTPSVKRVIKEITRRVASTTQEHIPPQNNDDTEHTSSDEDDYSKSIVNVARKIEKVKEQAEREIRDIAHLEDLKQQAQESDKYSYAWFKALLELESINSGENNINSREISISFSKVEREEGTSRTLILKHPNRYIPQSMEDLADIPLELYFSHQPMIKVAIEVVNVKSYTLRAKLRTNVQIDGIDLSLVTEARIEAKNPVFLVEELRKAFTKLGEDNDYADEFNMKDNLCQNIEFVFGPPGTGKTTYLAHDVILPIMRRNTDFKVLVLTPTNKAADVLVRRLIDSMGVDQSYLNWLVRFGATNDSVIEQNGVFRDKTFDIRTFLRNVTVTTIARFPYDYFLPDDSTRLHLNALRWDHIIIDEASMIPLINIIYPLFSKTPEKFIIAGDPFQIEPITTVDVWKDENIYTMVELDSFTHPTTVPYDYPVTLLTTQYRSIPEIGEIFSQFAYGGVLKHFRSRDSQRPLPIEEFIELNSLNIIKFPVSKYESIYRPKRLQGKTPYQVYSALFAFEFVKYLASLIELVKENEMFRIGLIAPYRAQADLIDKLMTSIVLPKNVDVQVGTIHGFQGDECDIVIALFNPPPSITTSKDMFLNKLNIVNVSISRARDYLFILMPDDNTENIDHLRLIKKVEHLCKNQVAWSEHLSSAIENMIFGSQTYLEDNSFSTSHQLVNVYGKPEKQYEIRSEDNAIDVQIHSSNLP